MGVVDIPKVKLLKKKANKLHKNLSKLFCKKEDLIAKLNESNNLVEKYKKTCWKFSWKAKRVWMWTWMLNLLMILNVKMNLLRCMSSVWLLNLLLKRMKIFVAIILWYPIFCLLCVLPQRTNWCTFLHTKEIKKWRERLLSLSLCLGPILGNWVDLSLFLIATIAVWSIT